MPQKICTSVPSNNNFKYFCEKCDYGCNKLFLYNQHLKTKKHEKQKCSKMLIKNMPQHKCSCGRIYKHVQSYNRHIKNCNHYIASNIDKEKKIIMVYLFLQIRLDFKYFRSCLDFLCRRCTLSSTWTRRFHVESFCFFEMVWMRNGILFCVGVRAVTWRWRQRSLMWLRR